MMEASNRRSIRSGSRGSRRGAGSLWMLLVCFVLTTPAFGQTTPKLTHDPFRPRSEAVPPGSFEGRLDKGGVFKPILQSTIVGRTKSLARLGGVLLEVGEETNGYRLLEVRVFDATFEHQGERIRLEVVREEGEGR